MDTPTPTTTDPFLFAANLLQKVKTAQKNFQDTTDRTVADIRQSLQNANPAVLKTDLQNIDQETSMELDDAVLGYIEDLDEKGEDFQDLYPKD